MGGRARATFRGFRRAQPAGVGTGVGGRGGFTLVEMLVVVAVLATLATLLAPSLLRARDLAERGVCVANIHLLQQANHLYEKGHDGFYAPGAPYMYPAADMPESVRVNCVRWFGVRGGMSESFSRDGGPLSPYLSGHMVKGCPSFEDFERGFEAGCGGYGYNNSFVGQYIVRQRGGRYRIGHPKWHVMGNLAHAFLRPAETVAFTDTAFPGASGVMEYSFCEAPKWPLSPQRLVVPSIHFRHLGTANVVWLDGHVSSERMTFSDEALPGPVAGRARAHDIGWFGPKTNRLFDCE